MAGMALSLRDRAALIFRAVQGTLPTDPSTVGGRLFAGVVQGGGTPPPVGIREHLKSYSQMPWLRAVVSRISFDIASTQWCLYVKKRKGTPKALLDGQVKSIQRAPLELRTKLVQSALDDGDLQPVLDHPLLTLLDTFNGFHVGLNGRRLTAQHLDLAGEAFWLLERDGLGMPIAVWPVPPSWVIGTPTIRNPAFRVSFKGWQGWIPATEFVWFTEPDPANPYGRGSGTAQSLGDELQTDEYASKFVQTFFFNRARPDIIVSPKGEDSDMQEGEVRRLEAGWNRNSAGFWRGFKPFFVRRAVEVTPLETNLRAQQFVQLREFERNTIIQTFGVSPEIFGIIAGSANRATIEMAEYIYGKRTLVPRLELQRAIMQERLVPEFDERLILHYVSPVREDAEMQLKAATVAPWSLTTNEWRRMSGHIPIEGTAGDLHMMPVALQPTVFDDDLLLNTAPQPEKPAAEPPVGEDEQDDDQEEEDDEPKPGRPAAERRWRL